MWSLTVVHGEEPALLGSEEPLRWTLRPMVMRLAVLVLVPVLASCGTPSPEQPAAAAEPATDPSVERLCSEAATQWGGAVAAAFVATVQDVRDYMGDPHGADEDPSRPRPGAYGYPAGWGDKDPADAAAVCYVDGFVPKGPPSAPDGPVQPSFDRRLVITADAVTSFMVKAGYQDAMPLEPLPRSRG